MKSLYRGKFQSYLKEALDENRPIIPPDNTKSWFWDIYRQSYQKSWNVRVEERYEHGKGVMLYLARYIKGGPVNPSQINSCTREGIGFTYLDHRTKRKKQLVVSPKEFLTRLLSHVPPIGGTQ
ncbi:transposase [Amphritea pacifica]|uniref:Transposase n=2 Tax=Amphritea pacifica TaxID=2811233 RepID=A0ABS2W484_9GAMM|nr:transposase [Amphritea pacifica]